MAAATLALGAEASDGKINLQIKDVGNGEK